MLNVSDEKTLTNHFLRKPRTRWCQLPRHRQLLCDPHHRERTLTHGPSVVLGSFDARRFVGCYRVKLVRPAVGCEQLGRVLFDLSSALPTVSRTCCIPNISFSFGRITLLLLFLAHLYFLGFSHGLELVIWEHALMLSS
jgi:hypothetical protein